MKNWKKCIHLFVSFILVFLFLVQPSSASADEVNQGSGNIYYVKPTGSGDCSSWEYACDLQVALGLTNAGDEVWVAAGTYKPTKSTNRFASFSLRSGVSIYGGFPAEGGAWEDRDWEENVTILSGDIGVSEDNSDNSYHVVIGYYLSTATLLDGFVITDGNADGPDEYDNGGGIYLYYGSCPLLRNLVITNNNADYMGGGIYSYWSSSPMLLSVVLLDNNAYEGGGMANHFSSSPLLFQVAFSNNSARFGGGMYNYASSNPFLLLVSFEDNEASYDGGGIYNDTNCNLELFNTSFISNSAIRNGGGFYSDEICTTLIVNSTFSGNDANGGGGIYNSRESHSSITFSTLSENDNAAICNLNSSISLSNSIVWGNTGGSIINLEDSTVSVEYSDVEEELYAGTGNISEDPLLGPLDYYNGISRLYALQVGSPAIDSANPELYFSTDQRGFERAIDGDNDSFAIADMGSYEYGSYLGEYSLDVSVNGNGNVAKNPEQTTYSYGEIVILDAIPAPGWSFSSWGGDYLFSRNPLYKFMINDSEITANFTQDEYSLNITVNPVEGGSVEVSPQQPMYYYDEHVTLTPQAAPGWKFDHWSGDVSDTQVPLELTITKTTFIRANFVKEERSLYLPLVLR